MSEREKRQNLITKAYLMIREINNMPKSNRRLTLIHKVDALASFMYYIGYLNLREYHDILNKIIQNDEISMCHKRQNEVFINLFENNNLLLQEYQESLEDFNGIKIKKHDTKVNYEKVYGVFVDFLKHLDIYSMYKEMIKSDMIKSGSKKAKVNIMQDGICIDNVGSSYIVLGNLDKNNFDYFSALIHELGHAYVNKIIGKEKLNYYDGEIYREIIPILFERMFVDYLFKSRALDNNKMQNIVLSKEIIAYYNLLLARDAASVIKRDYKSVNHMNYLNYSKLLSNKGDDVTPFIHHYALGYLISSKLFDDYKKDDELFIEELPSIIRDLSKLDVENLLKQKYLKKDEETTYKMKKSS